ncbi:hypothetical protein AGMMS49574_11640 [Bacteroidia bacterium]|nr:hypothetical protein AGMMS49574_11640 [Bacteroidia bacterium]
MNKKFFTLIASAAMLVASLGTANAQVAQIASGTNIGSLKKAVAGSYLYQLGVTWGYPTGTTALAIQGAVPDSLLSVSPDGVLHLDPLTAYNRPYGQSLWCINFGDYVASGDYHVGLNITNKASNKLLMVGVEDSYALYTDSINVSFGSEGKWGFSSNYEYSIEQGKPLYSYFRDDSVLFIIHDDISGSLSAQEMRKGAHLGVARMKAADFFAAVANPTTTNWSKAIYQSGFLSVAVQPENVVYFYIQEPARLILNANDFNTILNTKDKADFRKLTFTLDKNNVSFENPWSDHALKAFDANRTPGIDSVGTYSNPKAPTATYPGGFTNSYLLPNSDPWVYFALEKGITNARPNDKYLRVDTAYSASYSSHLVFNYGLDPTIPTVVGEYGSTALTTDQYQPLQGQYYFRLTYNVSKDSLGIDVAEARYQQKPGTTGANPGGNYWAQIPGFSTGIAPSYLYWGNATRAAGTNNTAGYAYQWYDNATTPALQASVQQNEWWLSHPDGAGASSKYKWNDADRLHVALVDLDKSLQSRLITIGAPTVNTYARLGIGACTAQIDFESKPEGLYTIINKAGQALGVPIYTDSTISVNSPLWTTLSQQEPVYLPSYQWVVRHTRSGSDVSPLTIINREFPNIRFSSVQLRKAGIVFANSATAEITKDNFQEVPVEISTNKYLGYLHLSDRDARLNTYDLNYLHAYNDEQYLGVGTSGSTKDAAIVKEGQTQFKLTPVPAYASGAAIVDHSVPFGYRSSLLPNTTDKWHLNIATLERTAYTLTQNGKVLTIDAEKRYVFANQPAANGNGLTDNGVFLIRTYNSIKKAGDTEYTHYYALLDTNSFVGRHGVYNYYNTPDYAGASATASGTPLHIGYVKVGIADGNVWAYAQVQRETRTSAFAIQEYTAPLYRRFDGGSYTYGDGNKKTVEPYKGEVDPDAPVWLKFHAIPEEYVFLAENSPRNKDKDGKELNVFRSELVDQTISFAGLYNNYQHVEDLPRLGYEFYVDTAFVKRTSAGLAQKPYTAMPQYMLALRPEILKGDSVWYQEGSNIWYTKDEAGNWVFGEPSYGEVKHKWVSGLTRGFYLFNAQDSVNVGNPDYVGKLVDNIENTTRFAFVDGIHQGDTFYVLPNSYKNVKTADIQYDPQRWLWSLPWYSKHYLGENTHYVPRYSTRNNNTDHINHYWGEGLYNATGKELLENGKSMVFQFRLKQGVNQRRQFYVESRRPSGNKVSGASTYNTDGGRQGTSISYPAYPAGFNIANNYEIGPEWAQYLNNLNGAPVQSEIVQFNDANLVNAAQGFDVVDEKADPDNANKAVSNESAVAGSVKVVGEVGSVSILNAAGKKVAISNVLGQSVANTVLTSDNATIALPKGIVVVAIEGEPAVKAVVK